MKIGIMSAMPDEIKTIHDDLSFGSSEIRGSREYFLGDFEGIALVLVYSGVGKVSAAMTATALIEYYQVDKIIFTGLAGAVSAQLERGDIILANQTYQHDMDARPLCALPFEIPYTGQRLFQFDQVLHKQCDQAIQAFLKRIDHYVDVHEFERLQVKQPCYYQGIIASGDLFVQNVQEQKNLFVTGMEALAVEMEGAAVAQVCANYAVPYALIRIISDKANGNAFESLLAFSEKCASHYASGIIQEILKLFVSTRLM